MSDVSPQCCRSAAGNPKPTLRRSRPVPRVPSQVSAPPDPRSEAEISMANPWFETVAVAQQRAKKRLPSSVYNALLAGSERGQSYQENMSAFTELGFAPHVVGEQAE